MDSKVKTQQRKQGFNNKERRSTNNNNNNVNNKKRSTQEDKPTQQPRRPRIQLRTPIDQIKLNEVQSEKIKELNEKLHELGEAVAPSEKDHTLKLEKLEKRINQIKGNIDTYRHMIDEEYAKRDSYVSKHSGIAPNALNQIQSSLNELYEKKSQIEKDIQENNDKHSKLQVQLRDIRSKSGIKNQEEALAKIDQIDHRIEVETLTSPQLRKLISERDRIFTVMKELVSADKLIKEDDDCRKRVNQLYEEKKKVQTQISELLQKRNSTRTQLDSLREETKKYNNQVQVYYNKIKELREELNGINGERGKEQNEYRKLLKEYRNKLNQITDIHYERDVIYREAERTMLQILEGQKLIGEIKERENPHQKEIAAGKSLITYLEGMQGHPQHKENKQQQNVQHTKRSNKEAEKLIASLKKDKNNNKNKNQRQKKNNMKIPINHSMDAISQFVIVDVSAPSNMSQVESTLEELKKKVHEWESEFVKAIVTFTTSEDGRVKVDVKVA